MLHQHLHDHVPVLHLKVAPSNREQPKKKVSVNAVKMKSYLDGVHDNLENFHSEIVRNPQCMLVEMPAKNKPLQSKNHNSQRMSRDIINCIYCAAHVRTGRMTALMFPYDACRTNSRKTVSPSCSAESESVAAPDASIGVVLKIITTQTVVLNYMSVFSDTH